VQLHELSIAQSMIELAAEQLARIGVDSSNLRVKMLSVRVGVMSGVVPEALKSAFDVAVIGTPLADSTLEVQTVGLAIWCEQCRAERELPNIGTLRCPVCQARTPKVVRGEELELTSMEVVNAHAASNS
jgi:hydrogenase nickel incorporation protein HypA/HybF